MVYLRYVQVHLRVELVVYFDLVYFLWEAEDININVPKMIKWEDIKLPDEWDLPKEMPPTIQTPINIADQDNLDSVVQYHDGTVKIKFDHSKPRIPPLIKYQSSRHSYSGFISGSLLGGILLEVEVAFLAFLPAIFILQKFTGKEVRDGVLASFNIFDFKIKNT